MFNLQYLFNLSIYSVRVHKGLTQQCDIHRHLNEVIYFIEFLFVYLVIYYSATEAGQFEEK